MNTGEKVSLFHLSSYSMAFSTYLTSRSSQLAALNSISFTGSTITVGSTINASAIFYSTMLGSTLTVSTMFGSTLSGSTMTASSIIARGLVLSTLTVSSINNNAPGTGTGTFSTLTVSSIVSVSSIQTASTIYASSMITSGNVGIGLTAPSFTCDVASSTQNIADVNVLSNTTYGSFGQTWTTISGPPTATWCGVALSATGQYQTAVYGSYANAGGVYYSNNYGATWTAGTITANQQYQTVAMSASGQYQVTGVNGNGGKIYVSTDYGVTWNIVSSSYTGLWNGFGVSSTGQYMVGVLYYYSSFLGNIYYSSDYGVTWTLATGLSSTTLLFTGVCCSGSGQYQTACANGGGLWYSSNYGASWTVASGTGSLVWVGVCCSLSGQYQSACILNGTIYYSSNYGVTWTSSGVANAAWQDICCDSTAQYQLCTVSTGKIWYSTNYGQTWTVSNSASTTWSRPRMSRYGQYSTAVIYNGGLASSNLSSVNQPFLRLGCGSSGNQAGIILNTWNARPGGPSCQIMSMDDGGFSSHLAFFSAASGSAGYTVSTERMRITANGSVGIGTNAPVGLLHVNTGTGTMPILTAWNNQWSMFGGTGTTAQAVGIGFCTTTSTYWNLGGQIIAVQPSTAMFPLNYYASIHNFYSNTTATSPPSVVINTSGYVGIGTSTPPQPLSVKGTPAIYGTSAQGSAVTTSGNVLVYTSSDSYAYPTINLFNYDHDNNGIFFDTYYSGGWINSTGGTGAAAYGIYKIGNILRFAYMAGSGTAGTGTTLYTAMVINSSGNIGIGSISPANPLDIYGSSTTLLRLQHSVDYARMVVDGPSGGDIIYKVGGVSKWGIACISNNLQFLLNDSTSTVSMTVTSGALVGIGTSAPAYKLDIVGNLRCIDAAGVTGGYICLQTAPSNLPYIEWNYNSARRMYMGYNTGSFAYLTTENSYGLSIGYSSAQTLNIDINNRVGIGTVSPAYPFTVYGGTGFSYNPGGNNPYLISPTIGVNNNTGAYGAVTGWFQKDLIAGGAVGTFSDRRIKNNIQPVTNALSTIDQLNMVSHGYIDPILNPKPCSFGLIAQDVKHIVPDAILLTTDFIPNIMCAPKTATINGDVIVLTFDHPTDLVANDLVRLVLKERQVEQKVLFVSDDQMLIRITAWKPVDLLRDQIFVYGKQVDDFHILDKPKMGLLALAGVKELIKQHADQAAQIVDLQSQVNRLSASHASLLAWAQSQGFSM